MVNTNKVFSVFLQNRVKEIRNLVGIACLKLIGTNRNSVDIVSHGVKPAELLTNRLWFSGPEFLTSWPYLWPFLKVGDKFTFFSGTENRGNDVGMCDIICEEDEGNRDNDVACVKKSAKFCKY